MVPNASATAWASARKLGFPLAAGWRAALTKTARSRSARLQPSPRSILAKPASRDAGREYEAPMLPNDAA
jgi:hypothetical protein